MKGPPIRLAALLTFPPITSGKKMMDNRFLFDGIDRKILL